MPQKTFDIEIYHLQPKGQHLEPSYGIQSKLSEIRKWFDDRK